MVGAPKLANVQPVFRARFLPQRTKISQTVHQLNMPLLTTKTSLLSKTTTLISIKTILFRQVSHICCVHCPNKGGYTTTSQGNANALMAFLEITVEPSPQFFLGLIKTSST